MPPSEWFTLHDLIVVLILFVPFFALIVRAVVQGIIDIFFAKD